VEHGADRFKHPYTIAGANEVAFKVAAQDTHNGLFTIEQISQRKGGPPRHLHHAQGEWFYIMEGEYVFEVAEQRMRMRPGDSLIGPRGVAHVWAYVGEKPGRHTWLYRIVTNAALMHRRAQTRRPVESLEAFLPEFDSTGRHCRTPAELQVAAHADEVIDRRALADGAAAALARLPDLYRSAFVLRDLEELTTSEVADVLGVAPATVRQHRRDRDGQQQPGFRRVIVRTQLPVRRSHTQLRGRNPALWEVTLRH
jgi:RNA polymerase sigma factor (sigma-70 family)